jgi:DNA-binding CsgD family transcriptional regulator
MHRRPPGSPNHPGGYRELSGREVEVLRLVAEGQSNKAIGVSMGLSALTVKSHLARIARKLGTGDRAGMVAVALRTGIIHGAPRPPCPGEPPDTGSPATERSVAGLLSYTDTLGK